MFFSFFIKSFLIISFTAVSIYGSGGSSSVENLYEKTLKPYYESIKEHKEFAKKRKTAYIISAILAVIVFVIFAKYFKGPGVVAALVMCVAGYLYLKGLTSPIGVYEKLYKSNIISPISYENGGYKFKDSKFTQYEVDQTNIFRPIIEVFESKDIYEKDGVRVGWIDIEFDTKENASVERFAENVFTGFLIEIDIKTNSNGVLISQKLKDVVADMDIEMAAFFAKGKRGSMYHGFELYDFVDDKDINRVKKFANKEIAFSFRNSSNKVYIALYKKINPLNIHIFSNFDIDKARGYANFFKEIDELVHVFR